MTDRHAHKHTDKSLQFWSWSVTHEEEEENVLNKIWRSSGNTEQGTIFRWIYTSDLYILIKVISRSHRMYEDSCRDDKTVSC